MIVINITGRVKILIILSVYLLKLECLWHADSRDSCAAHVYLIKPNVFKGFVFE